jgi:5-methylcytosine-specific restriction endonuclease McrA
VAKEAYYFSHDSNARNDLKIKAMRKTYGWQGYGWYWLIVELMRDEDDYMLAYEQYVFEALADEMQIDPSAAKEFIDDCITRFKLFNSDGEMWWSESLIRRMNRYREVCEIRSEAGKKGAFNKWSGDRNNINSRKRSQRLSEARKKGTHTKEEWFEMVSYFKNKCVICGGDVVDKPVKDHIIPIYQGGSDSITNLQPVCRLCNSSKGSDNTDYRQEYCLANALQMPSKWLAKNSKGNKRKEIKENKEKYLDFVYLSAEEHQKLVEKYGELTTTRCIEKLNNYLGSKGDKYKSHYHTILSWVADEVTKNTGGLVSQPTASINMGQFGPKETIR